MNVSRGISALKGIAAGVLAVSFPLVSFAAEATTTSEAATSTPAYTDSVIQLPVLDTIIATSTPSDQSAPVETSASSDVASTTPAQIAPAPEKAAEPTTVMLAPEPVQLPKNILPASHRGLVAAPGKGDMRVNAVSALAAPNEVRAPGLIAPPPLYPVIAEQATTTDEASSTPDESALPVPPAVNQDDATTTIPASNDSATTTPGNDQADQTPATSTDATAPTDPTENTGSTTVQESGVPEPVPDESASPVTIDTSTALPTTEEGGGDITAS